MTLDEVRRRVSDIWFVRTDPERAHGAEDAFYKDLLEAIRDGLVDDPRAAAREALRTKTLDFERWTV